LHQDYLKFAGIFEILGLLGVLVILVLVLLFFAPGLSKVPLSEVRLDYEQLEHLSEQARLANSIDDRINFLFNLMSQQVEKALSGTASAPFATPFARSISKVNILSLINLNTLFIMLPIIIVLGCLGYIAVSCSPSAVFLWGDYEEHYKKLVSKRNNVLNVIVTVIILGILTNLIASALWLHISR
jgi:hypothetical protein